MMVWCTCLAREENGFFPELPNQKVDLIYICSPNNPTGAVATKEQLKRFVDYANEHRAVIFMIPPMLLALPTPNYFSLHL